MFSPKHAVVNSKRVCFKTHLLEVFFYLFRET